MGGPPQPPDLFAPAFLSNQQRFTSDENFNGKFNVHWDRLSNALQ